MRSKVLLSLALSVFVSPVAQAGEQPFLGIAGEYRQSQERETGYRVPGIAAPDTRFDIDPGSTRELDRDAGYAGGQNDPFFRETIFTGQRARSVEGTGLNVFNRLLGID